MATLEECSDLLSETMQSSQVELTTHFEGDLVVTACEGELQQIFTNLLANSIEAMGSDGGTIRISARHVGDWIETTIDDTGPGISEDLRDRVFEPFYSTKRDKGGTGLGLSICAEIVRRNGGTLAIENPADDMGARFVLRLLPSAARG